MQTPWPSPRLIYRPALSSTQTDVLSIPLPFSVCGPWHGIARLVKSAPLILGCRWGRRGLLASSRRSLIGDLPGLLGGSGRVVSAIVPASIPLTSGDQACHGNSDTKVRGVNHPLHAHPYLLKSSSISISGIHPESVRLSLFTHRRSDSYGLRGCIPLRGALRPACRESSASSLITTREALAQHAQESGISPSSLVLPTQLQQRACQK